MHVHQSNQSRLPAIPKFRVVEEDPTLKFSSFLLDKAPEYTDTVKGLYRLGWNVSAIARYLSPKFFKPASQVRYLVKTIIESDPAIRPLTFSELIPILPIHLLVDGTPKQEAEFLSQLSSLATQPRIKAPLTRFDIYVINLLVTLSWKKRNIADLFKVSYAFISTSTSNVSPWSYVEVREYLPKLFSIPNSDCPVFLDDLRALQQQERQQQERQQQERQQQERQQERQQQERQQERQQQEQEQEQEQEEAASDPDRRQQQRRRTESAITLQAVNS